MRKASKIMLIIWDILLLPTIITVMLTLLGIPYADPSSSAYLGYFGTLCEFATFILAALSGLFLPQIISLVLITLNWAIPFRRSEPTPGKKDILWIVVLTIFAIAGAICSLLALWMMSQGEAGVPLP